MAVAAMARRHGADAAPLLRPLFAARLSFFIRVHRNDASPVAPLGADVALRTPDLDFDATTYLVGPLLLRRARHGPFNFLQFPPAHVRVVGHGLGALFAALSRASPASFSPRLRHLLNRFGSQRLKPSLHPANNSGLMGTCGR